MPDMTIAGLDRVVIAFASVRSCGSPLSSSIVVAGLLYESSKRWAHACSTDSTILPVEDDFERVPRQDIWVDVGLIHG